MDQAYSFGPLVGQIIEEALRDRPVKSTAQPVRTAQQKSKALNNEAIRYSDLADKHADENEFLLSIEMHHWALELYRRAIALWPGNNIARWNLLISLQSIAMNNEKWELALALGRRALRYKPGDKGALQEIAVAACRVAEQRRLKERRNAEQSSCELGTIEKRQRQIAFLGIPPKHITPQEMSTSIYGRWAW